MDGVGLQKANNSGEGNGPGWEQDDREQDRDAPFVPAAFQEPLRHRVAALASLSPCDHGRLGSPVSISQKMAGHREHMC